MLIDRLASGGIKYAKYSPRFSFLFAVSESPLWGSSENRRDQHDCRDLCRLDHALHGRTNTERRRPASRSLEIGRRTVLEENN